MLQKILTAFLLYGFASQAFCQDVVPADLKTFYDAHQWPALRDRLTPQAPALYRGAVAAAFGHMAEAQSILNAINQQGSDSEANDASKWLAYMYLRAGQYQSAGAQLAEDSPLGGMIRNLPNQSVAHFNPSVVSFRVIERRLFVPTSVGGKSVEFFIDSDANFSFLSDSAARNLGMTVHECGLAVHGITGREAPFRVAIASLLRVGEIELHNVTFLVLQDSEQVFQGLEPSQQGALGISVLLSFRSVRFGKKGMFEIGRQASAVNDVEKQNLYFDGADPVVDVKFGGEQLPFVLDTGAAVTEIWPLFGKQFPSLAEAAKVSSGIENGIGGRLQITQRVLPQLDFSMGGFNAHLRPAHMLLSETLPETHWYYGRIGLDSLNQAQRVTIEFESLAIRLE